MKRTRFPFLAALAPILLLAACARRPAEHPPRAAVLVVMDGLRPDYVTPRLMPNLARLAARGVFFENHHAAFPTVTRVNAATLVTGAYPAVHGLMGNSFVAPEVSATRIWSAANVKHLMEVEEKTGGNLLTAETLGEALARAGKKLFVASSGSTGSAFLLNHKLASGAIINPELILPEAMRAETIKAIGEPPPDETPNTAQNRWAVDAYLKIALERMHPDVSILWLSDPDHSAHEEGIGAPKMVESLRLVDAELGRILTALEEKGLASKTDVLVVSDHGFSTHAGGEDISGLLLREKLKAGPDSDDVIVAQGAIHVKGRDKDQIRKIVAALQAADWCGAIFTRRPMATHPEGFVPGTMSLTAAQWEHARSGDILVSADWSPAPNAFGWPGSTRQGGVAGHGTASPFDIHNTLVAAGPDFKRGLKNPTPSGNIDVAPTICHLLEVPRPSATQGRILHEALRGGPSPARVKVERRSLSSTAGRFKIELFESSVGGTDYMDQVKSERGAAPAR